MRRFTEILGKAIVAADSGRPLGRVDDLLIDNSQQRVMAVVVGRGWLTNKQVLPYTHVLALGDKAVVASSAIGLVARPQWRQQRTHETSSSALMKKMIIGPTGDCIGHIRDGLVEEQVGRVCGLEISRGIDDPLEPTVFIHTCAEMQVSRYAVLIPEAAVQELRAAR
jgi:uncharacterized protein YrrD